MNYRLTLHLLALSLIFSSCSKKTVLLEEFLVNFKINFTSSHCLGLKPTDEVLDSISTSRDFQYGKLVLISTSGERKDLSLNASGEQTITLKKGEYEAFHAHKFKNYTNLAMGVDIEKCNQWKKNPDFSFSVTGNNQIIEEQIHQNCSPCELPKP